MKLNLNIVLVIVFPFIFSTFDFCHCQIWLRADGISDTYTLINNAFGQYGASELPDCGHPVKHITQNHDQSLNRSVFYFHAHVNQSLDDDRCGKQDRQRTEIRPDPNSGILTATDGELLSLSWDFRLDPDFQPSSSWTHLHQLKGVGGDDSMPIITLQARKGNPEVLVVSHIDSNIQERIIAQADLDEFRGVWVHAQEDVVMGFNGSFNFSVSPLNDDSRILMSVRKPQIDMWRHNTTYVRSKYGIYRSLVVLKELRDEVVRFDNFCIGKSSQSCL